MRLPTPEGPAERGVHHGLAFTLWLPPSGESAGGVVILHGAGSGKESHHDFARACRDGGLAAICFDARGHGESGGAMDARAAADVARMADLLPAGPRALRGSSLGGYLALVAAEAAGAAAVVAVCPAPADGLARALRAGRLGFEADLDALDAFLAEHDDRAAAASLGVPVLLLHAEGDEQVPVEHSRGLARVLRHPRSRLIALPGGHHRSIQHDAEMQALSVQFVRRALAGDG